MGEFILKLIFAGMFVGGGFTNLYIACEDSVRWFYRLKNDEEALSFRKWFLFFKDRYWHKNKIIPSLLAVAGNGVFIITMQLFLEIFADPLLAWINSIPGAYAVLIFINAGYCWHVIMPGMHRKYLVDKSSRLYAIFNVDQLEETE